MGTRASTTSIFRVEELDCATEELDLNNTLGPLAEVARLEFDLVARRVTVHHSFESPAPIEAAIRAAGMRPRLITPIADTSARPTTSPPRLPRSTLVTAVVAGVLAIGSEVLVIAGSDEQSAPVIAMALAAIAIGGRETLRKGFKALTARRLTMNLLMSVAAIGAMIIGQWPEAAVVIWLFGVAELIEALSLERARNAIRSLVQLAPETAHVKSTRSAAATATGIAATGTAASGVDVTKVDVTEVDVTKVDITRVDITRVEVTVTEMATADVQLGDIVLIRPGERVPLDGIVVAGSSSINQAPITGESIPVTKAIGDHVFAGTINERGVLDVEVTAAQGSGTLDRIATSIQQAQSQRAPAQRFVDKFASIYTPVVFVLAIAVAIIPPVTRIGSLRDWVYRALVLLVLACPCALVISTPVTVVSGLGGAARRGILIKGGIHLEGARKLKTIALDKTGTLTHGKPSLTDIEALAHITADNCLRIAASINALSEHPVAHAITTAYTGQRHHVTDFEAIPGRGVSGTIDGVRYLIGSHRLAHDTGVCTPHIESRLERLETDAKTAVVLMTTEQAVAILAVVDTIRPESQDAIAQLRALGITPVMLTGDNTLTAIAVGRQVGITDVRGHLLPDDKLRIVGELAANGPVAMIGDGINDAPALAKAHIGIAMGAAGTDTAIETADVALMDDDPRKLAELIAISTHTSHVLWQNITIALGVKVVFFTLTMMGSASLWLAVLADMGASLVVIANGLRLLRRPSHQRVQ
jgi:Zn2+/Cd2+-exporting ATPase